MATEAELLEQLALVSGQLEGVRKEFRRRGNLMTAAIVLVIVGIGIALWSSISATNALNDYKATIQVARVASCKQYNMQQKNEAQAQIDQSHAFVAALAKGSTDPDTAQKVDEFNAGQDKLIRDGHPLRDCSPEGIAKYLSTPTTT